MNSQIEAMANQAVFQLQFNFRDAVRYVIRNSVADEKLAQQAIRSAITFHRR